jgi:hypothetical protein
MKTSSSSTIIKDLRGVASMPLQPEFGAKISVENHSRYPEPPREQEHYSYR